MIKNLSVKCIVLSITLLLILFNVESSMAYMTCEDGYGSALQAGMIDVEIIRTENEIKIKNIGNVPGYASLRIMFEDSTDQIDAIMNGDFQIGEHWESDDKEEGVYNYKLLLHPNEESDAIVLPVNYNVLLYSEILSEKCAKIP